MIPANWKKATIGELCQMVKGKSPTMKTKSGAYPLVTMGEEHKTADSYQLDTEAVCVPMISSFGHGKAGLKRVHYIKGKFALSNILTALVVKEPRELSTKYLALYLQTFKDQLIVPLQTGAANMSLRPEKLAGVPVHFPSLKKQEHIVSLVEEAETIRALSNQALEHSATLVSAFFYEMFGDPGGNQRKWKLSTLGKLGGTGQYGLNAAATDDKEGIRFIRITDINTYGKLEGAEPAYVPQNTLNLKDYELRERDILIARSGATAGKSYIHTNLSEPAVFAGYLIRFVIDESEAIPMYVASFLQTDEYWRQLNILKRAVAQPNVNAKQLSSIKIPIPPLSIQQEFVEKVMNIHGIEQFQLKNANMLDTLHKSILSEAFAGVL